MGVYLILYLIYHILYSVYYNIYIHINFYYYIFYIMSLLDSVADSRLGSGGRGRFREAAEGLRSTCKGQFLHGVRADRMQTISNSIHN